MAETHLQGHVYLDGYKLSGQINSLDLSMGAEALDNTTIDKSARTYAPGLKLVDCGFTGFWDYDSGTPKKIARLLEEKAGSTTDSVVGISHPATQAEGNVAWQFKAGVSASPLLGGSVSGLASLSAAFYKRGGENLTRSRLEAIGDKVATFSSTGSQVGVLASGESAVWSVHVYAFDGTSLDLILESDDNSGFTTPTTRDTMTQITAANSSQMKTLAGPIATDDYWRVTGTFVGTSFSVAVFVGGWGTLAGG